MAPTQIKLIKAAEVEFARHGFAGASVRAITSRAGVNLASVNYHFGTKADLFKEMVRYRIEPINQQRLKLLQDAYEASQGEPVPLANLVDIIVRPVFQNLADKKQEGRAFMRALARGLTEEQQFMADLRQESLAEVISRFTRALSHTLRGDEKAKPNPYALQFVTSSMIGGMNELGRADGSNPFESSSEYIDQLVVYITGGIRALDEFEMHREPR